MHKPSLSYVVLAICACPLLPGTAAMLRGSEPPRAEFGFEQRVRNEDWNNLFDYSDANDDERRQIRYRSRMWASVPLSASILVNVGINSETNQRLGQTNIIDEVVFDVANVEIRNLLVPGLSVKLGRQDIFRGDGLVLFEGTPWDGSRTTYFNAINASYTFGKSTLEALAITAPKYDRMLPRYHDQHRVLQDRDEQAFGFYFTDRTLARTTIESYLLRKREARDRLATSNPQRHPDRRVDTAGIRASRTISKNWAGTAELAQQWGVETPSRPIRAWAAYGYLKRTWDVRLRPFVTVGAWALSGDDPGRADRAQSWDPLFGRYPRWGDLELYSELSEQGVGYASNQKRLQIESGIAPRKSLALKMTYYRLSAFHPYAFNPKVFGSGLDRGNNFQARVDFQINSHMRGHVDYETLLPGTFYANRDRSYFLRFELIAQYRKAVSDFWQALLH